MDTSFGGTPTAEVPLCGHATLAAAFVLFNHTDFEGEEIHFRTMQSGSLFITRSGEWIDMNFPADYPIEIENCDHVDVGIDIAMDHMFRGKTKYLVVLASEAQIKEIEPDMERLKQLNLEGVIYTAPREEVDFVSRFFCPNIGINEDPVTGSAHTVLIPYWAKRLGKHRLQARQLSERGGELNGELHENRVRISGQAILYSKGEIQLNY